MNQNVDYELECDATDVSYCSKAIDHAGMCITIAGAQEAAGDYEGAIANYDEALAYPYTCRIRFLSYLGRGRVKSILRDYSGAIKDLEEALYYDFSSTEASFLKRFAKSELEKEKRLQRIKVGLRVV